MIRSGISRKGFTPAPKHILGQRGKENGGNLLSASRQSLEFGQKVRGFTLIELLTAVAIFAILSTVGILAFLRSRQGTELKQSAEQFASNVRLMQGYARSGKSIEGDFYSGFGLSINRDSPSQYLLFGDDNGEQVGNYWYEEGIDQLIQTYLLGPNTVIESLAIAGARTDYVRTDFVFVVPTSNLQSYGFSDPTQPPPDSYSNSTIDVVIKHTKSNNTKNVTIQGGLLGGVTIEEEIGGGS